MLATATNEELLSRVPHMLPLSQTRVASDQRIEAAVSASLSGYNAFSPPSALEPDSFAAPNAFIDSHEGAHAYRSGSYSKAGVESYDEAQHGNGRSPHPPDHRARDSLRLTAFPEQPQEPWGCFIHGLHAMLGCNMSFR